jgi:hypothetical protein
LTEVIIFWVHVFFFFLLIEVTPAYNKKGLSTIVRLVTFFMYGLAIKFLLQVMNAVFFQLEAYPNNSASPVTMIIAEGIVNRPYLINFFS